jgi:hypothetical protein
LRWLDNVLSCIRERPVTGLSDFIITVSDAMEVAVSKNPLQTTGAKLLVKKYRETFRIPENIDYYSKEDFQRAEKKYLKFCLTTGKCEDYRGLADGNRE